MDADLLRYLEGMEKRLREHIDQRALDTEKRLREYVDERILELREYIDERINDTERRLREYIDERTHDAETRIVRAFGRLSGISQRAYAEDRSRRLQHQFIHHSVA